MVIVQTVLKGLGKDFVRHYANFAGIAATA